MLTMTLDNGFNEYRVVVSPETALDEALAAWDDPVNDGCVLFFEQVGEAFDPQPLWYFNPANHARFVSGPVQEG